MGKTKRMLTAEEISFLQEEYTIKGYGLHWCAKKINCDYRTLKRMMKDAGFQIRTRVETISTSPNYNIGNKKKRKNWVNDDFFSTPDHDMAYLLGFIAADGTISKKSNRIVISLAIIDKPFLETIKSILGGADIKEYESSHKGHLFASWSCASKEIKHNLMKYGVIPNKTYDTDFTFPFLLEPKYRIDYIRGYFDGDGSVYADHVIRTNLVAHQKEIIQDIVNELEKWGVPPVTIHQNRAGNYYIRYGHHSSIKLYQLFYSNPESQLFLPRKRARFEQLLTEKYDSTRVPTLLKEGKDLF